MSSRQNHARFQWQTFRQTALLLAFAISLASGGYLASQLLPQALLAGLAGINILIILGLLLTRLLKLSAWLQWPLLLLASFMAGLLTALIQADAGLALLGLSLLVLNFAGLSLCSRLMKADFQRFNLVLAVLAICFAFVGMMLIFVEALPILSFIWTMASIICLDLLLYTLLKKTLQTCPADYFAVATPIVLLHSGLFVNLLLGVGAFRAL